LRWVDGRCGRNNISIHAALGRWFRFGSVHVVEVRGRGGGDEGILIREYGEWFLLLLFALFLRAGSGRWKQRRPQRSLTRLFSTTVRGRRRTCWPMSSRSGSGMFRRTHTASTPALEICSCASFRLRLRLYFWEERRRSGLEVGEGRLRNARWRHSSCQIGTVQFQRSGL
jgi:hypothetical protein